LRSNKKQVARKKNYDEREVVEKAMNLFWKNTYESTSMQMLEKEMGINKFSIYASFGNKHGLFMASLAYYKEKVGAIIKKFASGTNGVQDIKQFFIDSVTIIDRDGSRNGCLLTNTYNEFAASEDAVIQEEMNSFMSSIKELFIEKLRMDGSKDEETIMREANFLLLAKHGLAAASRVNTTQEIEDYIEMTFKNI
jgi:TetR/AcrR family transcriptional repressor of nem operon